MFLTFTTSVSQIHVKNYSPVNCLPAYNAQYISYLYVYISFEQFGITNKNLIGLCSNEGGNRQ